MWVNGRAGRKVLSDRFVSDVFLNYRKYLLSYRLPVVHVEGIQDARNVERSLVTISVSVKLPSTQQIQDGRRTCAVEELT